MVSPDFNTILNNCMNKLVNYFILNCNKKFNCTYDFIQVIQQLQVTKIIQVN